MPENWLQGGGSGNLSIDSNNKIIELIMVQPISTLLQRSHLANSISLIDWTAHDFILCGLSWLTRVLRAKG